MFSSIIDSLRRRDAIVWLIPVVVLVLSVGLSQKKTLDVAGGCIAILLLVFFVNRPGVAFITLIIFLPFEELGFSLLYAEHFPGSILRPATSLKELLVIAILISGLRAIRDTRRKLDRIDVALLLYFGFTTAYLIFPHLFSSYAPEQWSQRLLAYRADVGYVLIFFGARHAPIDWRFKERILMVIMGLGGVIAGIGLYQYLSPTGYSNFVENTAHVPNYLIHVEGLPYYTAYSELS